MPAEGVKLSGPRSRGKTVNGSFSGDTCNAGAEGATTHASGISQAKGQSDAFFT